MHALLFEDFGGPEVLEYRELPEPRVQPEHLLIDVKASGLNFADLYRRQGNYRGMGDAPYINGYEGAGCVLAIGENVKGFKVGDRIGFVDVARANVTRLNVPADRAIPIPDGIGYEDAASVMLQGLTAQYLSEDSVTINPGDWILIHAAAGGVGRHLTRFCRSKGAKIIAMASSTEKRRIAADLGANVTLAPEGDWVKAIRDRTDGGVHVAFDSVGSTLHRSIAATRARGNIVTFGMSGGNPKQVDPLVLMESSKALVGGDLWNFLNSRSERESRSKRLFDALADGTLNFPPIETFPLSAGAEAHRRLEDRSFTGKIVLVRG